MGVTLILMGGGGFEKNDRMGGGAPNALWENMFMENFM